MGSQQKTTVLITGANGGIGFDASAAFAAASPNYHVIMGSRSTEKGEKALADLKARKETKGSLSLVQLDVTNEDSIEAAVKTIESSFGQLDVLINNAGVAAMTPSLTKALHDTFETNVFGAALVTNAFVPLLKKSSNPRVIYVSSGLGSIAHRLDPTNPYYKMGGPANVYRMSKAALNMLAACEMVDFQEWGCKVTAMCPGYVVTNLGGEADRENRVKNGAESSETSAKTLLSIVQGERDGEAGKFVHKDGVYPW